MRPLVIYHGNCVDGFSAAWCFHNMTRVGVEGQEFDYHASVYGDPPPSLESITNRIVYIVDFSYSRDTLKEMASVAERIVILDHHVSAEKALQGLDKEIDNVEVVFDMTRSGAMIAWNYLFPGQEPPQMLKHVQDRDLWKFELQGTLHLQSYVFSKQYSFVNWDYLMNATEQELEVMKDRGKAIQNKLERDLDELLPQLKRRLQIAGHLVYAVSLPYTMASEACHRLGVNEPFAAAYFDTPTHRVFSLRSQSKGLDVSMIAEQYGGGGHKNASGFRVPRDHELARS